MKMYGQWVRWNDANEVLARRQSPAELERLGRAWHYAALRHAGQRRPAGEPYVCHLLQVVEIMAIELDITDTDLLVAGLLHDVVEDTDGTQADIVARFGQRTADLVAHVTMPDVLPGQSKGAVREAYLDGLRDAPADVLKLKLSDRYSNVQRLHTHPRVTKQRSYYAETVERFVPLAVVDAKLSDLFETWAESYDYLMAPVDSLGSVEKLAAALHREQIDKSGVPYVEHVLATAAIAKRDGASEHQQLAGLLHDAVEDTSCTLEQLQDLGVPGSVVELVDALTHRADESQEQYLARLARTPGAVLVKRADIEHNCSPARLQNLDAVTQERLRVGYSKALEVLANT